VTCPECHTENALMNLVCAYCGAPFADGRGAVLQGATERAGRLRWRLFLLVLLLLIMALAAGFARLTGASESNLSAGRLWLIGLQAR